MYQRSEQHKENYKSAAHLGKLAQNALLNQRKKNYYEDPKRCLNCETPIPYEKKRENKFCQKSCSASFNNKTRGTHSQETKDKISSSTKKSMALLIRNNVRKKAEMLAKVCTACHKDYQVKKSKKNQVFCSKNCQVYFYKTDTDTLFKSRETGRVNIQKQMNEGRWKGWSGVGENVRSFPESYIEAQLIKDGIEYTFQHQVSRYKIDFAFLDQKVALEVDGKQHLLPKQAESDKRKDDALIEAGWKVFRLSWKSIKTEKSKQVVDTQYQQFKEFLRAA